MKYCGIMAILGVNMHPYPMPQVIPCANTTCQYSVQMLTAIVSYAGKLDCGILGMNSPCHHQAEDNHEVAEDAQVLEVACVVDRTRQDADEQQKKSLDAAHP